MKRQSILKNGSALVAKTFHRNASIALVEPIKKHEAEAQTSHVKPKLQPQYKQSR